MYKQPFQTIHKPNVPFSTICHSRNHTTQKRSNFLLRSILHHPSSDMSLQNSLASRKYASAPTSPVSDGLPKAASTIIDNEFSLASHDVIDLGWLDENDDKGTQQLNPRVRTIRFASAASFLAGKLIPRKGQGTLSPNPSSPEQQKKPSAPIPHSRVEKVLLHTEPLTPTASQVIKSSGPGFRDLLAFFESTKSELESPKHRLRIPKAVSNEQKSDASFKHKKGKVPNRKALPRSGTCPGKVVAERMKRFEHFETTVDQSHIDVKNAKKMFSSTICNIQSSSINAASTKKEHRFVGNAPQRSGTFPGNVAQKMRLFEPLETFIDKSSIDAKSSMKMLGPSNGQSTSPKSAELYHRESSHNVVEMQESESKNIAKDRENTTISNKNVVHEVNTPEKEISSLNSQMTKIGSSLRKVLSKVPMKSPAVPAGRRESQINQTENEGTVAIPTPKRGMSLKHFRFQVGSANGTREGTNTAEEASRNNQPSASRFGKLRVEAISQRFKNMASSFSEIKLPFSKDLS